MKTNAPTSSEKAQQRLNEAMTPPDPMTTGLNPQGLADLGAADLEEALTQENPEEREVDAGAVPPNPYRPKSE